MILLITSATILLISIVCKLNNVLIKGSSLESWKTANAHDLSEEVRLKSWQGFPIAIASFIIRLQLNHRNTAHSFEACQYRRSWGWSHKVSHESADKRWRHKRGISPRKDGIINIQRRQVNYRKVIKFCKCKQQSHIAK
jgi:hypothetical protein